MYVRDIPVATLQPNGSGGVNFLYVHTDHLNSPRKIAQPGTGELAWRWDADPFGAASPNENPSGLGTFAYNLRFPGQYFMAETGLNQNWNRDYDPQVGRYTQSDPIGLRGGLNTYAYAKLDPVELSDPSGLDACGPQTNCWKVLASSLGGCVLTRGGGCALMCSLFCAADLPTWAPCVAACVEVACPMVVRQCIRGAFTDFAVCEYNKNKHGPT